MRPSCAPLLKEDQFLKCLLPSITSLTNQSLKSGLVAIRFKLAHVAPLLKKDGLEFNNFKNYQPVSNLMFISKVLERCVAQQLTHHLRTHGIQDQLQSANKPGHSAETAVLKIKSDIDEIMM